MPNSQATKRAAKPTSTSTVVTRSTSLSGTGAAEPLPTPQSPKDSPLPVKAPRSASTAKDFLCRAGFIDSKSEISTAALCSNLLAGIADRPDVSQTTCALIRCVNLILPEAFSLVSSANSQLCAITDKLDTLLSNAEKEPASPPTPPVLAELGEKLDKVTQNIQKATESWQSVPQRSRASPPPNAPPVTPAPAGPTRAEIAKNKRIQSQGRHILVEPNSDTIKKSLDALNARMLVTKAELAWDAAWSAIKDTSVPKALHLTGKPRVVFKAALRLARGGIRYELEDRTQAALLSDARISTEFEKGFGGASCKGQGATILLQCAPIHYNPDDPAATHRFEEENELNRGDVLSMSWCKPPHKRKPEQTMAVLKLEMRSHDLADRLITEGGQLDCASVLFRKANQEPLRCLRCQRYGHKAVKCVSGPNDVCSQCGEAHRIANCTNKGKKWCVPCQSDAHCSFDRECPTFRAECTKFNTRRPDNKNMLFGPGPPRPYDPRHRPINYPLAYPPAQDFLAAVGRTPLFEARTKVFKDMGGRPAWAGRVDSRKERGQGDPWDTGNVRTAPRMPGRSGPNAIPIAPPRLTVPVPFPAPSPLTPQVADAPSRAHTPPHGAYSPSRPIPTTPARTAGTHSAPATPRRARTSYADHVPVSASPVFTLVASVPFLRPSSPSSASTCTVTQ
ncbi:hypothetical protein RSOLAG1IB_09317 [Rhizoctonia solani AG-1 IB]|uniref:CCHC-type domain-containing protein n=1 Tax=Thanatephorus cucumeris (strain AG1-IB / isolate 7/3/14) TaxID=1108050 RepID=M5C0U4_THACB|nr:hypothetical protein BN14_07081 [Rhizoctonia solani AG-1 IB]CEL60059.1 hypothetical protein RSOLAG1IB_09317 [Rhizoctonia solani AG-1 IB]